MNNIGYLRKRLDLTYRSLEKECGIDRSTLNLLEKGKQKLTEARIDTLCSFFKVSSDFLLGKSDYGIITDKIIYYYIKEKDELFSALEKSEDECIKFFMQQISELPQKPELQTLKRKTADEIIQNYQKLYQKYINSRELAVNSEITSRQMSILGNDNIPADMKEEIVKLQSELTKSKNSNQENMVNLNKNLQKIIDLTQNLEKVQHKAQALEVEKKRLQDDNETKTKRINELETISKDYDQKIKELTQKNAKLEIESRKLNDKVNTLTANNHLLTNKIMSMQSDQANKMNEYNDMMKSAQEKMKVADLYFNKKSDEFEANNKEDMSKFKVDVEEVKVPKNLKLKFKPHNKGITSITFNSFGNNFLTSGTDNANGNNK